MAKPMQDAAASFERLAADPSPLLAGRGQLFSDEMLEPPDADLQPIIDELASDDALRTNVARFITAGLTKGLPQLLKHTAEYQPGGVAAVSTPEARAAAAALSCSSHQQEGDFGHIQSLCGSKGKARHQKLRSVVGHVKLRRNGVFAEGGAASTFSPPERRKYLALSRLNWAQRVQREGKTRKEIARKHAEGLKEHRDGLVAEKRRKEAEELAEIEALQKVPRIVTMKEAHHLGVPDLKLQLKIRAKIDEMKLDKKAITVGGNRPELLARLKACMLLADPHAADGYDITQPKYFYRGGGGATEAEAEAEAEAEPEAEAEAEAAPMEVEEAAPVAVEAAPSMDAEPLCTAERIEMSIERDGETHYLVKWVGCDEAENSWVASSSLERYGVTAIELAASFEAGQLEEADRACTAREWQEKSGDAPVRIGTRRQFRAYAPLAQTRQKKIFKKIRFS